MLQRAVNQQQYGGKVVVTCNTCHQGHVTTAATPDVSHAGWNILPTPVYEHPVDHPEGRHFIDLAYPGPRRVAVECVGRIGHDFDRAFESDPVRRNRLQLLGWIVIEVTWRRFVKAPESVIAEVAEARGW